MDLSKQTNERKLYLCKCYFFAGFALLPFMWAVNAVWFAQQAFIVPEFQEQKQIRRYVILSAVGAIVSFLLYFSWIITFQHYRASWGEFGDDLSFVYPAGEA
ncbi:hypothetical protein QAD02_024201 [Eretmocerus hayati]|uniref:Uncharacterized protein n=1 Tax=Eretmocerus hayati TaxID=131215 RepID=A0ACC2Q083_9HYME|nr:hypothetical protein QAD02_024201 [Eretmocerus hayati]